MNTQIAEYSKTAAALAELTDIYQGVVYDVTTTKGMAEAKAGRKELRTLQIDLEAMRVTLKAPALERCRLLDAEAKDIDAKIEVLRNPIHIQITTQENREKEAAMAKAIAERQALEAAEAKAKFERDEEERKVREAEQAKMAAERAEIAKQQAELAEQQRVAREAIEAEQRASRLKIEEEQRAARQAQEAIELAARKEREAQEAVLKAERDRLESERMAAEVAARKVREEAEAIAKIERDRQEAIERQNQRRENEKLDARAMLTAFVNKYDGVEEFASVTKAINKYFSTVKEPA